MSEAKKTRLEKIADRKEAIKAHPKGLPLNEKGQLLPDPTPIAPPIGYVKEPSMWDIIKERNNAAYVALMAQGFESEEEANDFLVDDDPELLTPYEIDEQTEIPLSVLRQRAFERSIDKSEAEEREGVGASGASQNKAPASPPPSQARKSCQNRSRG